MSTYVPMDAMEISYTNTRAHTLHVDIVQSIKSPECKPLMRQ